MASCVQKPTAVEAEVKDVEAPPALSFKKIEWKDSVVFSENSFVRIDIDCEYPAEGSQEVVDSINAWIIHSLICVPESYAESQSTLDSLIEATVNAKPAIPDFINDNAGKTLKSDSIEVAERYRMSQEEGIYEAPQERELSITKSYEDSLYVTLLFKGYIYLGGAHGSTMIQGATFSKKDGHRMDWELTSGYTKEELNDSIKAGVKAYFEVKTDQELYENLQIGAMEEEWDGNMPLPATPPYLSENGIEIIYQQYEIACYAAGMPCCTLKKR